MFSKRSKAERTAADAWDYLSSAMASLGESARDTADVAAGKAGEIAGGAGQALAPHALTRKAAGTRRKLRKQAAKANRRGQLLAGRAQSVAGEARSRANAAADALAGRRPGRPWGLIAGIGLIGVAVGWVAAATARAAAERQAEEEELARTDNAVVVTPTGES